MVDSDSWLNSESTDYRRMPGAAKLAVASSVVAELWYTTSAERRLYSPTTDGLCKIRSWSLDAESFNSEHESEATAIAGHWIGYGRSLRSSHSDD